MKKTGHLRLASRSPEPLPQRMLHFGGLTCVVLIFGWLPYSVRPSFLAPLALAQENATITGSVLDPTGAVLPNVTITITNIATGQIRQSASNSAGMYTFANVGVGHFNLEATATGFEKFTRTDIVVNTDQTLKKDVTLTVGNAAQTVTVRADALGQVTAASMLVPCSLGRSSTSEF